MLLSELNYMRNTLPKCPHCGENFPVWSEDHPLNLSYEDGGRVTFACESCGKDFICVTDVTYLFSTAVSEVRADDEEWGPVAVLDPT